MRCFIGNHARFIPVALLFNASFRRQTLGVILFLFNLLEIVNVLIHLHFLNLLKLSAVLHFHHLSLFLDLLHCDLFHRLLLRCFTLRRLYLGLRFILSRRFIKESLDFGRQLLFPETLACFQNIGASFLGEDFAGLIIANVDSLVFIQRNSPS